MFQVTLQAGEKNICRIDEAVYEISGTISPSLWVRLIELAEVM